jgi:glycosyltransferase involved in cell wall biosynthesis
MKALANELEIAESVVWRGFLDGHDKESIMRSADIFVLPSYSENFGVAVVEAMGAGLPVIVSDQVGIHREIAREQAGLVVHCGEEALATALLKASRESAWRASAGAAGRELAKQFSPLVVSKQCLNLYRRVATVSSGT